MGSTVFPVPSSGAGLPAGATEKVASGFVKNGYASVSGSFPAGKYLVVADSACNVNFTTAAEVNGYQNAIFSKGGSCVVDVPVSSNVIEYTAALSYDEYASVMPYNNGGEAANRTAVFARKPKMIAVDGMPTSYGLFPYKDKLIALTNTGGIWKSSNWEGAVNTGLSAGFSPNGFTQYLVGTNGTTWRGCVNPTTSWYTTNPEAGGWSTQSMPNTAQHYIYGNGVWLALATGSTTYSYSTDNGSTWSTGSLPMYAHRNTPIAFGNGKFVITGSSDYGPVDTIAYSTDGINWTNVTIGSPDYVGGTRYPTGVAFGNGRFITGWSVNAATTDLRSMNTFVSVDGINWVRGSSCGTTSTSGAHDFFPIFDGTGFNMMSYTSTNNGWRTTDGFNNIQISGSTPYWNGGYGWGSRGKYMGYSNNSYNVINTTKSNTTFAIYKLDPSYATY